MSLIVTINPLVSIGGYALLTAAALSATSAAPVAVAPVLSGLGPAMAALGLGRLLKCFKY